MRDINVGKIKEIIFDFINNEKIIVEIVPETENFTEILKLHIYGNPKITYNGDCHIDQEKQEKPV